METTTQFLAALNKDVNEHKSSKGDLQLTSNEKFQREEAERLNQSIVYKANKLVLSI